MPALSLCVTDNHALATKVVELLTPWNSVIPYWYFLALEAHISAPHEATWQTERPLYKRFETEEKAGSLQSFGFEKLVDFATHEAGFYEVVIAGSLQSTPQLPWIQRTQADNESLEVIVGLMDNGWACFVIAKNSKVIDAFRSAFPGSIDTSEEQARLIG